MDLPLWDHHRRYNIPIALPNIELTSDILVKWAMAVTRGAQYDLDDSKDAVHVGVKGTFQRQVNHQS